MKKFMMSVVGAAALLCSMGQAATAQDSFDVFAAHDSNNERSFSYAEVDAFIDRVSKISSGRTKFYYDAMLPEGVSYLDRVTDLLGKVDPTTLSKPEQISYWLNLHNLLVIRAIAAESPGRSLKRARGDAQSPGEMWTRKRMSVNGVALSIEDIESKILLRHFDDPHIVYGLYQGVRGGPTYPAKSFTGPTIEADLKEAGKTFVNQSVRVKSGVAVAPPVLLWRQSRWFADDAALRAHLAALAEPPLKAEIESAKQIAPGKLDYALDEIIVRQQVQTQTIDQSRSFGGGPSGS